MSRYYSIYDREGKVYRDSFPAPTDSDACRMVTASMLTPQGAIIKNTPMYMFASQFDLMHTGSWNSETGVIEAPAYDYNRDTETVTPRNLPVSNLIALVPKEEK